MSTENFDFEDLLDSTQQIEDDVKGLVTDEFGEIIDEGEDEATLDGSQIPYSVNDDSLGDEQEKQINHLPQNHLPSPHRPPQTQNNNLNKTWLKCSVLAPSESEKEFEMFSFYCKCGGGRTIQYVSETTNIPYSKVNQVAKRNNWAIRVSDYDRYILAQKLNEANTARHQQHLNRLEQYREQQEQIGHQLSLNAARIAFLADRKLSAMLDSDQNMDLRDLPSMLNAASKLAEVGKNLQSNALGVDQLLAAIEESEID